MIKKHTRTWWSRKINEALGYEIMMHNIITSNYVWNIQNIINRGKILILFISDIFTLVMILKFCSLAKHTSKLTTGKFIIVNWVCSKVIIICV